MNVGIRSIIVKDGNVVFVKQRSFKDASEILVFPGGGVEEGEALFQAVQREVKEELNIVVNPIAIMYIRETAFQSGHGMEFYIKCEYVSGNISLGMDPELAHDKQILSGFELVPIQELNKRTDWVPEELSTTLTNDLLVSSNNIKYLGVKQFD